MEELLDRLLRFGFANIDDRELSAWRGAFACLDLVSQVNTAHIIAKTHPNDGYANKTLAIAVKRFVAYAWLGAIVDDVSQLAFVKTYVDAKSRELADIAITACRRIETSGTVPRKTKSMTIISETRGELFALLGDLDSARACWQTGTSKAARYLEWLSDSDALGMRLAVAMRIVKDLDDHACGFGPGVPFRRRC